MTENYVARAARQKCQDVIPQSALRRPEKIVRKQWAKAC